MVALVNRIVENVGGWLCLTRKRDEVILAIHEDGTVIEFKVGEIHNNRVGVLVRAPGNVRILREELKGRPMGAPKRAA